MRHPAGQRRDCRRIRASCDAAHQRVEKALHGVAEQLYKAQAGEQPPAAEPPGAEESAAPEDVVDAEYTEEKSDS